MQVLQGHLLRQCGICSGPLRLCQTAADLKKQLGVFRNIARYHSFDLLMEVVDWLLEAPFA